MPPDAGPPLGVIALGGALPLSLCHDLGAQQKQFHCICFQGVTDKALAQFPNTFVPFFKIGEMLKALRRAGVRQIVFAGQFFRPNLFKMRFDMTTLRYLPLLVTARGHGDDSIMQRVTNAFEKEGFDVVSLKEIAPQMTAGRGVFGLTPLADGLTQDIALGFAALKQLGSLDIGQSIVIDNNRVIAIEAAEGTDAMLKRVHDLRGGDLYPAPKRSGVLVKAAKPQQQLRNDMPVIGINTVENAVLAGLKAIVVEADKVVTVDLPEMVQMANREKLAIVGVDPQNG